MKGAVVLGMHRSGTSAVTRVLNLLGAAVPAEDDLLTNYDNPDGHWESRTLVGCNDRILDAFGRSWDFPPRLAPGWASARQASALVPELTAAFDSVYPTSPWVWKDPRTCLTFPLWRQILGEELCVVLVWRDPSAVTASIRKRDGIPRLYGAGLWLHYLAAALAGAQGLPTVCVDYDELHAHPARTTARLAEDLASLGLVLDGDVERAAGSVHPAGQVRPSTEGRTLIDGEVERLTAAGADVLRSLPRCSPALCPPDWRTPPWVRPLLFAYRGPWMVRARLGHPLRPRAA